MKSASFGWALQGAIRFAIATAVVALVLANVVEDPGAERFATAAYVAACFLAIALGLRWFCAARPSAPARFAMPTFPAALGFTLGVAILLAAAGGFAENPGAELQTIVASLAAVAIAAFGRAGAFAWLGGRLARGGRLAATIRYGVVVAIAGMALSAILPEGVAEGFTRLAFSAAVFTACALVLSLLAPTLLGELARDSSNTFERLSGELVVARIINFAVTLLVASFGIAAMLPRPYSIPFAAMGYFAAVLATAGVALACRRTTRQRSATT